MSAPAPDEYDAFIEGIADVERRAAVKAWLGSELKTYAVPDCNRPVRVMDGHVVKKAGLMHRACATVDE